MTKEDSNLHMLLGNHFFINPKSSALLAVMTSELTFYCEVRV